MEKNKSVLKLFFTFMGIGIFFIMLMIVGSKSFTADGISCKSREDVTLTYENNNLNERSDIYGNFMTEFYLLVMGENIDFNKLPSDSLKIYLNKILDLYPNVSPIKTIDSIQISSKFGWRISPVTRRYEFHKGVDIRSPLYTNVHSTMSGEISDIMDIKNGYGNCVIIKNKLGFKTLYAHLSRIYVKKDQQVNKGQLIASVGRTGDATGPEFTL